MPPSHLSTTKLFSSRRWVGGNHFPTTAGGCRPADVWTLMGGRRQRQRRGSGGGSGGEGCPDAPRANFYRMDARLTEGSDRQTRVAAIPHRNICRVDVFGESLAYSRVLELVLLSGVGSPGIYWNPRHGVDKINLPSVGHIEAPRRNKLGRSMLLGVVMRPVTTTAKTRRVLLFLGVSAGTSGVRLRPVMVLRALDTR